MTDKKGVENIQSVSNIDIKVINDFFANIATDPIWIYASLIQVAL